MTKQIQSDRLYRLAIDSQSPAVNRCCHTVGTSHYTHANLGFQLHAIDSGYMGALVPTYDNRPHLRHRDSRRFHHILHSNQRILQTDTGTVCRGMDVESGVGLLSLGIGLLKSGIGLLKAMFESES